MRVLYLNLVHGQGSESNECFDSLGFRLSRPVTVLLGAMLHCMLCGFGVD